jgi:hypothetical protein
VISNYELDAVAGKVEQKMREEDSCGWLHRAAPRPTSAAVNNSMYAKISFSGMLCAEGPRGKIFKIARRKMTDTTTLFHTGRMLLRAFIYVCNVYFVINASEHN